MGARKGHSLTADINVFLCSALAIASFTVILWLQVHSRRVASRRVLALEHGEGGGALT